MEVRKGWRKVDFEGWHQADVLVCSSMHRGIKG